MFLSDEKSGIGADSPEWRPFRMQTLESGPQPQKKPERPFSSFQREEGSSQPFVSYRGKDTRVDAESEAAQIVAHAKAASDAIEQEAYEKGFAQGEKDGFAFGRQKVSKIIEKIEGLLSEISGARQKLLRQYERELLDIVFAISKKVVYHLGGIENDAVKGNIIQAIGFAAERGAVVIRINPEDHAYVTEMKPELFLRFGEMKSISVVPDSSVTRGGCMLETPNGNIDGTLESQLNRIYESLDRVYRTDREQRSEVGDQRTE